MDPDDTDKMLAFASTVPCPPPDTERCYSMPEPEHEPFGPIVRPVTLFPTVAYTQTEVDVSDLFDLSSEDLDDES